MKPLMTLAAIALAATAALATPASAALKEGTQAPDFTLPAYLAGKPFTFNLADALKKGPAEQNGQVVDPDKIVEAKIEYK